MMAALGVSPPHAAVGRGRRVPYVAASSHRAMLAHPLCRRGPSSPPVKMQQPRKRDAFRSHCDKRAGRRGEPEPEPELESYDPDMAATVKNCPLVEEMLNKYHALLAAKGERVPPDMFIKEKERISYYMSSANGRSIGIVCSRAQEALDLASKVMDIAREGSGRKEFSQHTTDQMVKTYGTIFCNVAEDAYHKKIETENTLSFFGALRGLGAICHILVQDTVAKLKDGHLKNKITHDMDTNSLAFYKKVKILEDEVATINEQELQRTVIIILDAAVGLAASYIFRLTKGHKLALDYL